MVSVFCLSVAGIDANITDCQGRTALEILREHPAQKSQQITALMQEYMMEEMMDNKSVLMEEPICQCPVPTPRTSIPSPSASPSLRHKNDAVTGELSKLLNEMKMCRDRDYSFEELCQTISSHSHSMESFGSGHLSDEERRSNGTLSRVRKRPLPTSPSPGRKRREKSCGPAGFWEALTPCNGCHNLGFSACH
ncbi:ankyrin repeat and sterile alpha motif domain-containing protein 1B-like, partial [Oncorhynchus tshawytscha]|uniref:ankyrin repeat and sterile alpha motif domain-containing protein 1B-like n=1 Tax=Oncorhynchus tshawytscha TaxID=74940 RepID=UPI001C3CD327